MRLEPFIMFDYKKGPHNCEHCGRKIKEQYHVRNSIGKTYIVGMECVKKLAISAKLDTDWITRGHNSFRWVRVNIKGEDNAIRMVINKKLDGEYLAMFALGTERDTILWGWTTHKSLEKAKSNVIAAFVKYCSDRGIAWG